MMKRCCVPRPFVFRTLHDGVLSEESPHFLLYKGFSKSRLILFTCERACQSLHDELNGDFFDYAVATRHRPTTKGAL